MARVVLLGANRRHPGYASAMLLVLLACSSAAPPAPPSAPPSAPYRSVFIAPITGVTAISRRGDQLYVAAQPGTIWKIDGSGAAQPAAPQQVADLSDRLVSGGERGLLGLAFSGDRAYVNYTYELPDPAAKSGKSLRTRVSSFPLLPTGQLDTAAELEILSFAQPWSNHNSGALAFAPDGTLYIGVGDGGSGGDPRKTGQNPSDWLGSILRVDVSVAPYRVPADNPFVGRAGFAPEVWAYGLRNPWGAHFDGATLYFADVGQDTWEEVNRGVAGANYGWRMFEGSHCFGKEPCDQAGLTMPLANYNHDEGNSVTGGIVYRGPSIPMLDGRYLYADFVTGRLWALPIGERGGPPVRVADTGLMPSAFGQDAAGRLYVADYKSGVLRLDPPG